MSNFTSMPIPLGLNHSGQSLYSYRTITPMAQALLENLPNTFDADAWLNSEITDLLDYVCRFTGNVQPEPDFPFPHTHFSMATETILPNGNLLTLTLVAQILPPVERTQVIIQVTILDSDEMEAFIQPAVD